MSHVSQSTDWTSPAAMAIPSEGYFMLEQVWYGPTYPRTPACHGFSIVAKIKPGTGRRDPRVWQAYRRHNRCEPAGTRLVAVFEKLEGFPADWKTNAPAFIKFVREHPCPSFLECGEYPYVSAAEIKKAPALNE